VARPPARRPSRRSRSGNANADQLSFFDPVGELQALHREERQLRTQKLTHDDHRRFLQEAIHNARDRVRAAEEDLARAQGWTGRSASEVVIARGGQPRCTSCMPRKSDTMRTANSCYGRIERS
jgi:hypothetical protein